MRKTIKQLRGESDYWRVKFINEQQRAEAAEAKVTNLNDGWLNAIKERDEARAKLAELERQEPDYYATGFRLLTPSEIEQYDRLKLSRIGLMKLFTRPAPAVSLAELVPEKWTLAQALEFVGSYAPPSEEEAALFAANAFRDAILRNIEEAK